MTSPAAFAPALGGSPLREAVRHLTRMPEPALLPGLADQARMSASQAAATEALALRVARGVRERAVAGGRAGLVQGLLQEFALSSAEGVALMCLAEALLRIPDAATRDALIRDKIGDADWQQHLGQSPSIFVNAASWGLLLTGKLVATHSEGGLSQTLRRVVARGGEPLIRKGVDMAMRMMGEQFVTGETIEEALANAQDREAVGFRYSYDMLGEAAMTRGDAERYRQAYEEAINAIGQASAGRGIVQGPGISIKLSALHPRYARAQLQRVRDELYPVVLGLATLARRHDIGLNIDAEESDRLDLSLDLLERLCGDPELAGWNGLGFVIQAYQKRCPAVVDLLVDMARRHGRRLMVRLVKGAYWDSEIKRAQVEGQAGYPVYTRKAYTDLAYIACARKLLAAPDAVFPQFATHNAHTLAAIHTLADPATWHDGQYEFQCLHGMGEPLYEQVVGAVAAGKLGRPCRIYAPVGTHDTLLAYLVRRLLENGANTSFVNRIADENLPLETLVEDPVATVAAWARVEGQAGLPHPGIALPAALYGASRRNSAGLDLADEATLARWSRSMAAAASRVLTLEPILASARVGAGAHGGPERMAVPLVNPADVRDTVGTVHEATVADVSTAVAAAHAAAPAWAATQPAQRARILDTAADLLEADIDGLVPLLVREAGKTLANAVAELREAVDFLRYDACQLRRDAVPVDGAAPAASADSRRSMEALGTVVCISPWNFPLAIFAGQVAAALAAGNVVLAKPAEQTPLVAAAAVRALHAAGVPAGALQLLPGRGETVGAALVADARVQGVLFTGSTEVARLLQRKLAERLDARGKPVTLIAETGGQNALIVDSSALVEQAVADIVSSAFDSAGQRCSALRLLCVQDDAADRLLAMLQGAVMELQVGDPRWLCTDVGPVIDAEAQAGIDGHVAKMRARGRRVWQAPLQVSAAGMRGFFVPPTVIEIDDISELRREIFGPVLHVLRYRRERLAAVLHAVAATGYGLTQGVHTRIDETVAQVVQASTAGNIYVNRNIVGAVVGVQPFGGERLSGTGPKAGGPLYLYRLLAARPAQAPRLAVALSGRPSAPPVRGLDAPDGEPHAGRALTTLRQWAQQQGRAQVAAQCDRAAAESPVCGWLLLDGPTGEANLYRVQGREHVLCSVEDTAAGADTRAGTDSDADTDRLLQLACVLAVGGQAVWPASARAAADRLPAEVRDCITLAQDVLAPAVRLDAAMHHGSRASTLALAQRLARRPGPIVGLSAYAPGETVVDLERLVAEQSLSVNTAAAGGNASLMTLG